MAAVIRIGLISDTHGLLRPDVHAAFAGVERILHAVDEREPQALEQLPFPVAGERQAALAQARVERRGLRRDRVAAVLAGGDERVVELAREPHGGHQRLVGGVAAPGVREHHHALARALE